MSIYLLVLIADAGARAGAVKQISITRQQLVAVPVAHGEANLSCLLSSWRPALPFA
jgi:hypothetical protein